jgi:hypothetical protein
MKTPILGVVAVHEGEVCDACLKSGPLILECQLADGSMLMLCRSDFFRQLRIMGRKPQDGDGEAILNAGRHPGNNL